MIAPGSACLAFLTLSRSGHQGLYVLAPGRQPGGQVLHLRGMLGGQVVPFAQVVAEVVQLTAAVLVPFDELPVAVADHAARGAPLAAIMRPMPEERTALDLTTFEQRYEAHAVAVFFRRQRQAGEL